ncbi:MAG TPA: helix-turn-helix domain-containing protein [Candidatus Limnocylindrales bacterium]|jgi:AcrR family transcriptional regulator|nr:helix-turn-helix domain-containing protein [Candidatus Limnocylindrales bacterium]
MAATAPDSAQKPVPVRDRLLQAAKILFSIHGFENTSTALIARQANTSESQLIKHFGSKEGLLESIFEDGWRNLDFIAQAIKVLPSPADKLRMTFELVLQALERDQALKELMLFEGRRIRKASSGADILVTGGYLRFSTTVEQIISEMLPGSPLAEKLSPAALASALIGMFESMLRDQVLARRLGHPATSTPEEVRTVFELFVNRLLALPR